MKNGILFILFVLTFGCSQKVKVSDLLFLNGYWQINRVEDLDGNKKEYPINEVYDFFEIKNKTGFHKKVVWQPTGKFLVNDIQENLLIDIKDEAVFFNFNNRYGKHSDKLVAISEKEMVLVSNENVKYFYTKVILEEDNYGKKN